MRALIKRLAEFIAESGEFNEEEHEQIEYAFKIIIFESLKLIGILSILYILGVIKYGIIVVIVMMSIKPFIGGYHEDSQIKCFIVSVIIILMITYISIDTNLNNCSLVLLDIFNFLILYKRIPIMDSKMPFTKIEYIKRTRRIGLGVYIIYMVTLIIFRENRVYVNTVTWTFVFQCLLLFNKNEEVQIS